ncbi:membrane protein [Methanobrevibacter arboriphilus]|jgi:energy-converting hydrogenase A subunit G|uniref:Membrane protein n=1 Tax=Methanobrevibacter arboriphilus TaxID=39441 RepID=A0ACA8R1I4_METAZ|nr:EhaG family protein [Methanobrevibacter arboriphilus]BBL61297.1 membrane protein [Methanobrevibacter arboriphilus]GLI11370.1 membrane protein [Methanobrevibacter arboriphilus]
MVTLVPEVVPAITASLYLPALYVAIIVGFVGLTGIAIQKRDIHILILTDLVGLAMLIVVAAVGTDLAEALILPGLVVELAEIMAISEILISREMRKAENSVPKDRTITEKPSVFPLPLSLDMEIMKTAPNFIALVMILFGAFLTGFTGGAVAGGGILFYMMCKKARGLPVFVIEGVGAISGISWCLWIVGFVLFFLAPQYWLLSLFMAACGLVLKVASKLGLIGSILTEEYRRE